MGAEEGQSDVTTQQQLICISFALVLPLHKCNGLSSMGREQQQWMQWKSRDSRQPEHLSWTRLSWNWSHICEMAHIRGYSFKLAKLDFLFFVFFCKGKVRLVRDFNQRLLFNFFHSSAPYMIAQKAYGSHLLWVCENQFPTDDLSQTFRTSSFAEQRRRRWLLHFLDIEIMNTLAEGGHFNPSFVPPHVLIGIPVD